MRGRLVLFVTGSAMLMLAAWGCEKAADHAASPMAPSTTAAVTNVSGAYTVVTSAEGAVQIFDPGGASLSIDELAARASRPVPDGEDLGLAINFNTSTGIRPNDFTQQFPGFFIYAGRVDTHNLTPCVLTPVKHIHIYVKRSSSTPDDQAWAKIHLGKYTQNGRTCLVLFDSAHPWICLKLCAPSISGLQSMLVTVLTAAVGSFVAGWLISAAASVLAPVLYAAVLAL